MNSAFFAAILGSAVALAEAQPVSSQRAGEGDRPIFHFTPERYFINDPNGLVYVDGLYHLFYQHNPEGDRWGHMSWGHAISRNLFRWEHWPLALREEGGIMIFSGSAILDSANTSRLGTISSPPIVAVYTGHGHGKQTQNLASSTDGGKAWVKYPGNPVLDLGLADWRDPKVFWHGPTSRWVMVTALAVEHKVRFDASTDLKSWTKLSEFGPAGSIGSAWECPDLIHFPREDKWILKVDAGPHPTGGPGGQYFIGSFDGQTFAKENSTNEPLWIDAGKDFYAAQSWSNLAPGDDPLWLAWMNNWQYANEVPTTPWRGAMTIPRRLRLINTQDGPRLAQQPVEVPPEHRGRSVRYEFQELEPAHAHTIDLPFPGDSLSIRLTVDPGEASQVALVVRAGENQETQVGFASLDKGNHWELFVDRSKSGQSAFSKDFAARHASPWPGGQPLAVHLLVDRNSVEAFSISVPGGTAEPVEGLAVLTDLIFPKPGSQGVRFESRGGKTGAATIEVQEVRAR